MKKVLIAMIIIIILIMLTSVSLLYMLKNNETEQEENVTQGDLGLEVNYKETNVEQVSDNISFFTIQNSIQEYLNTINIKSSSYYDDFGVQIVSDNEIATNIFNLLSKQYIDENSITIGNVLNNIDKVEENLIFVPLKMNFLTLQNITKYAVYGFCINWQNEYINDLYYIVDVDENNKTFSITPLKLDEYGTINDIELNRIENTIQSKDNNKIVTQNITDQFLCEQYFLIQKRLMLAKPETSYNYLDEEYKHTRFENIENYLKYVSENKEHISKMAVKGYDVERKADKTIYRCKDQYDNYYIFNTAKVLDYTILLDIYTIEQEKSTNAYLGYNRRQKIAYNVNKWVQMVNNKDYQNTYNLLNKTFRENKWNNLLEYENYIKQNFPSYYKIEFGQYEENGENSIQTITLKDIDGKEPNKTISIVIRLKENMNFEMSIAE